MFDRQLFTAEWEMHLNGKKLDDDRRYCIDSIALKRQSNGSDTLNFEVTDTKFLFLEDNIFVEEATVLFRVNLTGDLNVVTFEGYISAIDVSFPDTGAPVLSIFCMDNTHRMNREEKSRSWDNTTSAEVVKKIAKEYGFKCVVEKGYAFEKQDTITQSNQTDIAFCESLADDERDKFMCKLIGDTLYYKKKNVKGTPKSKIVYRGYPFDIKSADLQINKETQQEKVTKSDINTDTKKTEKTVATGSNTVRDQNGESVKTSSSPVGSKNNLKYDPITGKWNKV